MYEKKFEPTAIIKEKASTAFVRPVSLSMYPPSAYTLPTSVEEFYQEYFNEDEGDDEAGYYEEVSYTEGYSQGETAVVSDRGHNPRVGAWVDSQADYVSSYGKFRKGSIYGSTAVSSQRSGPRPSERGSAYKPSHASHMSRPPQSGESAYGATKHDSRHGSHQSSHHSSHRGSDHASHRDSRYCSDKHASHHLSKSKHKNKYDPSNYEKAAVKMSPMASYVLGGGGSDAELRKRADGKLVWVKKKSRH